MVHVPSAESVTPETTTETQVTPVVTETKKARKAREAAEKKAAAEAAVLANPPAEGATPPVKKVTEKTYGKGLPNSGMVRTYDLPWSAKKVVVLSTLKALGATGLTSAKSAKEVINAAATANIELSGRDVRHYCYHGAAGGLTGVADKLPEGAVGGGYGFYLTQLGMDTDYDAVAASLVKPVKAETTPATTVPTAPAPKVAPVA